MLEKNMNCRLFSSLLWTTLLFGQLAAQLHPCLNKWLTTSTDGDYWSPELGDGIPCDPRSATSCNGGPNSQCIFSLRTYSYRCCHDVWSRAGVDLASHEGWAKPMCPYGAKSWGNGFQALACNINNLANAGCPISYTCTKSINQPPTAAPYATARLPLIPCKSSQAYPLCQAYQTPYVCCLTSSLPGSMTKLFALEGLSPSIIPIAPIGSIQQINFGYFAYVRQGDDWSSQRAQFTTSRAPTGDLYLNGVTLAKGSYTNPSFAAGRFHVLIFDATTNKDILLFLYDCSGRIGEPRIPADAISDETPAVPPKVELVGGSMLSVSPVGGVSTLSPYYAGPGDFTPMYTNYATHDGLLATTTKIVVTNTATGTFQPRTAKTAPGRFTTVTAFLNSQEGKQLGPPVAGTFFYL